MILSFCKKSRKYDATLFRYKELVVYFRYHLLILLKQHLLIFNTFFAIKSQKDENKDCDSVINRLVLSETNSNEVFYTYDISWVVSIFIIRFNYFSFKKN